ncbi:MAG: ABC transporter permease [Pseudorhodobacter sp.]
MQFPAAQRPAKLRFRFFRSFGALILREMTTTYGRSPGGYIWAILEPVGGLVLLSIVFSFIMRAPPLGMNFPYFFAGGLLPFGLYMSTSLKISTAIRYSQALLEYPAVSFVDALLARFALNVMTQILVTFIVLAGIIMIYDLNPILRWGPIFMAMAMATAMGFGIGVLNCYLITAYPLWERAWAVLNRPMFILSGVMFTPEILPWQLRDLLLWNPLFHVTSEMRKGLFVTYEAKYVDSVFVFLIAAALSAFGLMLLLRHHKEIILK